MLHFIFATMRKVLLSALLTFFFSNAFAQGGGFGVFPVLKQPSTPLMSAWGGYCNAYISQDVNLISGNPAAMNLKMHNRLSMNINSQFPGVWSGNAAYSYHVEGKGQFGVSFGYIDYGTFDMYDAGGNYQGKTIANEVIGGLYYSKIIKERLSVGAALKGAYSVLGGYIGNGAMLDMGALWTRKDSILNVGLSIRNAGFMIVSYTGQRESLPFSAELGVNFKPRHMPFRFNIVAHNLQKPDITYNQFLQTRVLDLSGNAELSKPAGFGDKMMRHISGGLELVLGPHFGIMGGYNHQRRKEMAPDVRKGVSGFSWGIRFKVSKFHIAYSSAAYFPGYNVNLFSLSTRFSDFVKK